MNSNDFCAAITTCGNPDHGQDPSRKLPDVPLYMCTAATLEELQKRAAAFIVEHCIGGGNWVNPKINHKGKDIGFLSYNCRAWSLDGQTEIGKGRAW